MLQLRSVLKSADNSGAHSLVLIGIPGRGNKRFASVGDIIRCVVRNADAVGNVKDHEKVLAVIVRTKKEISRRDGSYIRFDDNAAVVLESVADKKPRATRIFGPVAREIKELGFNKIASMAKEVY